MTSFIIDTLPSTYTPEYGDTWIIVSTWIKYVYNGLKWIEDGTEVFNLNNNVNISGFPGGTGAYEIWNSTSALTSTPPTVLTLSTPCTSTLSSTATATIYVASPNYPITLNIDGEQTITIDQATNSTCYTGTWIYTSGPHIITAVVTNSANQPAFFAFAMYVPDASPQYPVVSDQNWTSSEPEGTGVSLVNNLSFDGPNDADILYPDWASIAYLVPSWFPGIFPSVPVTTLDLVNPVPIYLTFLFYYPVCSTAYIFMA